VTVHHITSLDSPQLEPYRTLRRSQEHIKQGIFVAEGEKVVRRLLESDLSILSLLLTEHWLGELRKIYPLESPDIFIGDRKLLESIVGYPLHQGIMAVARVPKEPELGNLLQTLPSPFHLVALDGIVSAENVGVIVRNSAAFGVHAILTGKNSSSPYLRRAVRNSMGAVFTMPVLHLDLQQTFPVLKPFCKVIGASPNAKQTIFDASLEGNLCLILGNEGTGVSEQILSMCDEEVAIPMMNRTDSLNVASASAVFLYEIQRRYVLKVGSASS
jgi:tRNA G18 (ribose-2'-O)-methylase SpoU